MLGIVECLKPVSVDFITKYKLKIIHKYNLSQKILSVNINKFLFLLYLSLKLLTLLCASVQIFVNIYLQINAAVGDPHFITDNMIRCFLLEY